MKLSKKIIICIGLVVVMLSSGIYVMAHEISESGKIEVIFDENSIFTEEEKEIIEASFLENGDGNTPALELSINVQSKNTQNLKQPYRPYLLSASSTAEVRAG